MLTPSASPEYVPLLRRRVERPPLLRRRSPAHLDKSYLFQPIAVETNRSVGLESFQFLKKLGQRIQAAQAQFLRLPPATPVRGHPDQEFNSVLGTLDKPDIDPFDKFLYLCMYALLLLFIYLCICAVCTGYDRLV